MGRNWSNFANTQTHASKLVVEIELARAKRTDAAHSGRVCLSDRTASNYVNNLWSPNVMD